MKKNVIQQRLETKINKRVANSRVAQHTLFQFPKAQHTMFPRQTICQVSRHQTTIFRTANCNFFLAFLLTISRYESNCKSSPGKKYWSYRHNCVRMVHLSSKKLSPQSREVLLDIKVYAIEVYQFQCPFAKFKVHPACPWSLEKNSVWPDTIRPVMSSVTLCVGTKVYRTCPT